MLFTVSAYNHASVQIAHESTPLVVEEVSHVSPMSNHHDHWACPVRMPAVDMF